MRLAFVHADRFAFEATAPVGDPVNAESDVAESDDAPSEGRMDEVVVAFVTVEHADTVDLDAAVADAAGEVRDVLDHLDADRLVLYPTPHLSDNPADRGVAAGAVRDLHAALADSADVLRAPVDRYTAVEASWKGHPHAVTSRRAGPASGAGWAGAGDGRAGRRPGNRHRASEGDAENGTTLAVAFPDGAVLDAREAVERDRIDDALRALLDAERGDCGGGDSSRREDRFVDALADAGLAHATDGEDSDHLRWSPRGTLARDLLVERVTDLAVEAGAVPVEGWTGDERGIASGRGRDSALPQDLSPSASDLPLRLYEREGGTSSSPGPSATTPTITAIPDDRESARAELRRWVAVCRQVVDDLGLDAVPVVRTSGEVRDDGDDCDEGAVDDDPVITSLADELDRPVLLDRPSDDSDNRTDCPVEVAFAAPTGGDSSSSPTEIATVQFDAERLDVRDGDQRHAVSDDDHAPSLAGDESGDDADGSRAWVVRCALVTGVGRALAASLAQGADTDAPLPTWLAPTQVQLVPVGDEHAEHCDALADDLDAGGVRVDVDDREATVGERVARAERDRVPYLAVVGDREMRARGESPTELAVTDRDASCEREWSLEELAERVREEVADRPEKDSYLPRRVADWPAFSNR